MRNATLIISVIYDPNYLRLHRWIQKCGWYLAEFYENFLQDGGPTNREILSFRQYDRYRKHKNIFGLVWSQAFRKGRFFKNRSINNENTRPPSWKFKKNCYSVIYHPILSCDTSLNSENRLYLLKKYPIFISKMADG